MIKKLLFAVSLLSFVGTAVMAAKAPLTLQVIGGSGKVMVNGKEYVPGTALPKGAKIQVIGDATIKIGGATVKTSGGELKLSGNSIRVVSGTAEVTSASGQTQTLAAGQQATFEAPGAGANGTTEGSQSSESFTSDFVVTSFPQPSASQNSNVSPSN